MPGAMGLGGRPLRAARGSRTPTHTQRTPAPVITRLNHKSNIGAYLLPPILKTVDLRRNSPFTRSWR